MVFELKTKTAVYISLSMAKGLLGTPVPDGFLNSIRPNLFKIKLMETWLSKVGIFEPDAHKWSKVGYIIFVSLLYDSLSDFISGVFPSSSDMRLQYGYSNKLLLPYYYLKRLVGMLFKRARV